LKKQKSGIEIYSRKFNAFINYQAADNLAGIDLDFVADNSAADIAVNLDYSFAVDNSAADSFVRMDYNSAADSLAGTDLDFAAVAEEVLDRTND
jgi:hypothetical protein